MSDPAREWLAQVCREAREDVGFKRSDVASDIGRENDVVRDFETLRGGWNLQTGAVVSSYAKRAGIEPVELWRRAINRWAAAQEKAPEAGPVGPRLGTARDAQSKPGSQRAKASRRP